MPPGFTIELCNNNNCQHVRSSTISGLGRSKGDPPRWQQIRISTTMSACRRGVLQDPILKALERFDTPRHDPSSSECPLFPPSPWKQDFKSSSRSVCSPVEPSLNCRAFQNQIHCRLFFVRVIIFFYVAIAQTSYAQCKMIKLNPGNDEIKDRTRSTIFTPRICMPRENTSSMSDS